MENHLRKLLSILLISFILAFPTVPALALTLDGINYTVIEKYNWENYKCRINIRLEQKVPKDFLQKLAVKLQQEETIKFARILISYYLPGMIPGSSPWATSNFNPDLEVKILGTTVAEEKALESNSKGSSAELIGEWFDDPYVGTKYTLIKNNGKIFMIQIFKDGSRSEKEMVQRNQSGRLRFDEIGGNKYGEYYLIDINEQLAFKDNTGHIVTMRSKKK